MFWDEVLRLIRGSNPFRLHPVYTVLAITQANEQSRSRHPFHVLHDSDAGHRQLPRQHANGCRPTRQALEDHDRGPHGPKAQTT
jgi:hypothetical protein